MAAAAAAATGLRAAGATKTTWASTVRRVSTTAGEATANIRAASKEATGGGAGALNAAVQTAGTAEALTATAGTGTSAAAGGVLRSSSSSVIPTARTAPAPRRRRRTAAADSTAAPGGPPCTCGGKLEQAEERMQSEYHRLWNHHNKLQTEDSLIRGDVDALLQNLEKNNALAKAGVAKTAYTILLSGGAFLFALTGAVGPVIKKAWQSDAVDAMEKKAKNTAGTSSPSSAAASVAAAPAAPPAAPAAPAAASSA